MSHRKSDNKDLSRLLRYASKHMDGKERNAFERRLQKDPFEADAAEGLSLVSGEEADEDLAFIAKKLRRKGTGYRTTALMRAASLAGVLLVSALVFKAMLGEKKEMLLSENNPAVKEERSLPVAATEGIKKAVPVQDIKEVSKDMEVVISEPVVVESSSEENYQKVGAVATVEPETIISPEERRLSNFRLMDEMEAKKMNKPATITATAKLEGTVISVDDGLPLPGASVVIKGTRTGAVTDIDGHFALDAVTDSSLMLVASYIGMETREMKVTPDTDMLIALKSDRQALEEVVVVGYGTRKAGDAAEEVHTPPLPVTGNEAFRKYLKENQHYPDFTEGAPRVVVVISMTVGVDGSLSDIAAVRSPSKAFTDEAIRLIKEGPRWSPATVNNTASEEKVRVRIVFNP